MIGSAMVGVDGEFFGSEMLASAEKGGNRPFTLALATFNAGNGKRGVDALQNAMERMVQLSSSGPGIMGFQELPPAMADELSHKLPAHWQLQKFVNTSDKELSMAMAYDASQLKLHEKMRAFHLPSLPSWHRFYELHRRNLPLVREAQVLHFTLIQNPIVHIIVANAHLSAKGFLPQRRKEMDLVMSQLCSFMQSEGLVDASTDALLSKEVVASYVIGDFNTPGRVGSKRNERQIAGLQLFEQGFVKLNDRLDPTSSALSSTLHMAQDIFGDQAREFANRIGEHTRRGVRQEKMFARALELSLQHRDHIFGKLYGLQEDEVLEQRVYGPPHHPIESDHFMVFTGSILKKTPY